ncbi:hypothetical protein EHS25_000750 [Saitozyma podzolica]|uniref:Uncharacterized protein n=1 Tax=Saitozyma podzolica TaxID=1890683 RepID=A0A427YX43_9TREE|nr:hypothetical protein EHS25_000750 [Saitozyma podzolica]
MSSTGTDNRAQSPSAPQPKPYAERFMWFTNKEGPASEENPTQLVIGVDSTMSRVVPQHERVDRVISIFESEMYRGWPSASEEEFGISLVLSRLTLGPIEGSDKSMEIWKWDGQTRYHADKCEDSQCAGFDEPQYPLRSEGADCSEETFTYDRKLDGEDGSALRTYFAKGDNVILGQEAPSSSELTGRTHTELTQRVSLDVCIYRPEYRTAHIAPVDSLARFHASGEDNPLCWGYHTRALANEAKMQSEENGNDTRCNPGTAHTFEPPLENFSRMRPRLRRSRSECNSSRRHTPMTCRFHLKGPHSRVASGPADRDQDAEDAE